MAPWKTSTAGSARSTSTSSNRRQACLKAALWGGFLISSPLLAQTARYRSTQLATASPYELRYALAWQRSVRNRKKNEHRRHAILHGLDGKGAFEIRKRVRVCPRRMPASFHSRNAASQRSRKTKPPNQITPSLMASKLYVFQQCAKEYAAERRPGNKKKEPPRRVAL